MRGGLLQDHNGRLIFAFNKEFGEVGVLIVESSTFLHGPSLCKERALERELVEVDFEALVRMLHSGRWLSGHFVMSCGDLEPR